MKKITQKQEQQALEFIAAVLGDASDGRGRRDRVDKYHKRYNPDVQFGELVECEASGNEIITEDK